MLHVDIVRNEWSRGRQVLVARVRLEQANGVQLDTDDPETWAPVVLRPLTIANEEVGPKQGERFLRALHEHMRGDYLFATEAHDESHCEYPNGVGSEFPLKSGAGRQVPA